MLFALITSWTAKDGDKDVRAHGACPASGGFFAEERRLCTLVLGRAKAWEGWFFASTKPVPRSYNSHIWMLTPMLLLARSRPRPALGIAST